MESTKAGFRHKGGRLQRWASSLRSSASTVASATTNKSVAKQRAVGHSAGPAFTIFAVVVDSLKALYLEQPIREANC